MLENLSSSVEIKIQKALKFSAGMLSPLQHWVPTYDITGLSFLVISFLHGGVEISFSVEPPL